MMRTTFLDAGGSGMGWLESVVARACKCLVTRLPMKAGDTLVVHTVFLVMADMITGHAE